MSQGSMDDILSETLNIMGTNTFSPKKNNSNTNTDPAYDINSQNMSNDKDTMKKILSAYSNTDTQNEDSKETVTEQQSYQTEQTPQTNQNVDKQVESTMSSILQASGFQLQTDNVTDNVVKESEGNKQLNEALSTQKTQKGVRVGSWEIEQYFLEEGSKKKIFDVVHTDTNEPIAKDLMVYEAAHALVKLFNNGYTITDNKVQQVINLEEKFSRAYMDAAQFKKKAKKYLRENNDYKTDLYESRYTRSKDDALSIKKKLVDIVKNI